MEAIAHRVAAAPSRAYISVHSDAHADIPTEHRCTSTDIERHSGVRNKTSRLSRTCWEINGEVDQDREGQAEDSQVCVFLPEERDCSILDQFRDSDHLIEGFLLGLWWHALVIFVSNFFFLLVGELLNFDLFGIHLNLADLPKGVRCVDESK